MREVASYRASYEDTLLEVARRFSLGYVELIAANPGTDPWVPGAGTDVVLPTVHLVPKAEHEGIVINLADMRLYFFGEFDVTPRSYPIGIGRDGLTTPLGVTEIARKKKDPVWRPTERMREEDPKLPEVVGPGPDNPMGTRAMYLGWPLYAIHGTNNPWAVGRRSSSGCIRMYPEHVEELYELVEVGTKITVVDQPIKLNWVDGELFMEAHPTQGQSDELETEGHFTPQLPARVVDQVPRPPATTPPASTGAASARRPWNGAGIRFASLADTVTPRAKSSGRPPGSSSRYGTCGVESNCRCAHLCIVC